MVFPSLWPSLVVSYLARTESFREMPDQPVGTSDTSAQVLSQCCRMDSLCHSSGTNVHVKHILAIWAQRQSRFSKVYKYLKTRTEAPQLFKSFRQVRFLTPTNYNKNYRRIIMRKVLFKCLLDVSAPFGLHDNACVVCCSPQDCLKGKREFQTPKWLPRHQIHTREMKADSFHHSCMMSLVIITGCPGL